MPDVISQPRLGPVSIASLSDWHYPRLRIVCNFITPAVHADVGILYRILTECHAGFGVVMRARGVPTRTASRMAMR